MDGQTGGWGRKGRKQSDGKADRALEARTGGRNPRGTNRRMGGWVEEAQTGGLGGWGLQSADGASGGWADGRIGRRGGGLGFKRRHSSTPFHSWASSPLASSKRVCVGCLGVPWGPGGFPLKYSYLVPGLTCLV